MIHDFQVHKSVVVCVIIGRNLMSRSFYNLKSSGSQSITLNHDLLNHIFNNKCFVILDHYRFVI